MLAGTAHPTPIPTEELGQCPGTPGVPRGCFRSVTRDARMAAMVVCEPNVPSTLHMEM